MPRRLRRKAACFATPPSEDERRVGALAAPKFAIACRNCTVTLEAPMALSGIVKEPSLHSERSRIAASGFRDDNQRKQHQRRRPFLFVSAQHRFSCGSAHGMTISVHARRLGPKARARLDLAWHSSAPRSAPASGPSGAPVRPALQSGFPCSGASRKGCPCRRRGAG